MEPIVLSGLVVLVYGGYFALLDFLGDVSACFPRRAAKATDHSGHRGQGLKPPIKKMAGMHV